MKFNLGSYLACLLLAATFCPLFFIGQVYGQDDQEEGEFISRVIKRQVRPSVAGAGRGRQEVSTSGTSASMSASAMASSNNNPDRVEEKPSMQSALEGAVSGKRPAEMGRPEYNMDQNSRPPKSKNPSNRRPPTDSDMRPDEGGDEENCSDDYYEDYRQLVNEPMRHFGRMMNNVFGQMSAGAPMNSGNGWAYPSGGNSAFASSSSVNSGDGYSRMTSSVSNNGRMRGIISETRNGRTQTRRIGRADEDDEADEDVNSNPERYVNDEE